MRLAICDSSKGDGRLVVLSGYNSDTGGYKYIGRMVYCPGCGNLQVTQDKEKGRHHYAVQDPVLP